MQNLFRLITAVIVSMLFVTSAAAADKTLVTVNGVAIPQTMAEVFVDQAKATGAPDNADLRSAVREDLINRELMFQAAQEAGFDKKPEVAAQVDTTMKKLAAQAEAAKQTIITRAWLDDYVKKHPVTDALLKQSYDAYRARGGNTEYKVRHILVANEADANAIIAQLDKGAKFEDLAKRVSTDTGTRANGGDLGWVAPARITKPFGDALASVKKGHYTATPVKTEYGYHIIKVDDTRPLQVPTFEEMKPMLQRDAQAMMVNQMIAEQRAKARIQ